MGLVMKKAEGKRKGTRIRELEDEVKEPNKLLQSVGLAPRKLLDLQVTQRRQGLAGDIKTEECSASTRDCGVKGDRVWCSSQFEAAVSDRKHGHYHQYEEYSDRFGNGEDDASRLEADLKVERSTESKLWAKLHDLLVAEVKLGKVLETMEEKAMMKGDDKDTKYSPLYVLVDRVILRKERVCGSRSKGGE